MFGNVLGIAQAGAASIPHNGRQCRWPLTEESRLAIPPTLPSPTLLAGVPHQPANIASAAHARSTSKNSESEPGSRVRFRISFETPRRNLSDKKKRKIISKITSFRVNLKISFGGLTMCAYAKWIGSADPRSSMSKTEWTNRPRARSRLYRRASHIPNAQDRRLSTYNVATEPYLGQK
jgi:hypothetical protein